VSRKGRIAAAALAGTARFAGLQTAKVSVVVYE